MPTTSPLPTTASSPTTKPKDKKNPITKIWHVLTTGWVLEYPDPNHGPRDFFDRKPGVNGGHPAYYHRLGKGERHRTWTEVDGETETLGGNLGRDGDNSRDGGVGDEEDKREDGCLRWCEEVRKLREREGEGEGEGREMRENMMV